MAKLDGLAAQYAGQVHKNVQNIETADIHRARISVVGEELGSATHQVVTHVADVERDARKIINRIREGVGKDYFAQGHFLFPSAERFHGSGRFPIEFDMENV